MGFFEDNYFTESDLSESEKGEMASYDRENGSAATQDYFAPGDVEEEMAHYNWHDHTAYDRCGGAADYSSVHDFTFYKPSPLQVFPTMQDWAYIKRLGLEPGEYDVKKVQGNIIVTKKEEAKTVDLDELIEKKRDKLAKTQEQLDALLEQKKSNALLMRRSKIHALPDNTVITFSVERRGTTYTYAAIKLRSSHATHMTRWYLSHSTQYQKSPMMDAELADFIGDNEVKYVNHWDWNEL